MEDIKEVIERLTMKAITSKTEAKDYPNCIVSKKDLITVLNRLEQLEKENKEYEKIYKEYGVDDFVKEIKFLRKENEELKEQIHIYEIFPPSELELKLKDSIPKSMIENKINKLEESLWEKGYEDEKSYAIKVLKKILEEEK